MTTLSAFLAALAALLLIALVMVLAWSLGRERYYEKVIRKLDAAYAEALRRQGELSAEVSQLSSEQVKAAQRASRMEQLYNLRGELIRDLGLDPQRLEQGRESLHGVTAITRIRIGVLLAAELNQLSLQNVAETAGERSERAFLKLARRLGRGDGGNQQDQQSRELLLKMIDEHRMDGEIKADDQIIQ